MGKGGDIAAHARAQSQSHVPPIRGMMAQRDPSMGPPPKRGRTDSVQTSSDISMEGMAEALRIPSPTPSMVSVSDESPEVDPQVVIEVGERLNMVAEDHQPRVRALIERFCFLQSLEYMRKNGVGDGWDDSSSEEEGEIVVE